MPNTEPRDAAVKLYTVRLNNTPTLVQLTEADAKRHEAAGTLIGEGDQVASAAAAPAEKGRDIPVSTKLRHPANK